MKLYVWGTGCAAGDLIDAGLAVGQVTAFLDSEAQDGSFLGRAVLRPEEADTDSEYLVLVASRHAEEITRRAAACGMGEDRLLFLRDRARSRRCRGISGMQNEKAGGDGGRCRGSCGAGLLRRFDQRASRLQGDDRERSGVYGSAA